MTLKVWLNDPGNPSDIADLFHVHRIHVDANRDGEFPYYEGAASMGINGYRFTSASMARLTEMQDQIRRCGIPCEMRMID